MQLQVEGWVPHLTFCAFCFCRLWPSNAKSSCGSTAPTTPAARVLAMGATPLRGRRLQEDCPARHAGRITARQRSRAARQARRRPQPADLQGSAAARPDEAARRARDGRSADGQALLTILQALGLARLVPLREVSARSSRSADVVIAIDETPVGVFVEIEGGEAHIQDGPPAPWARTPGRLHHRFVSHAVPAAPGSARRRRTRTWCSRSRPANDDRGAWPALVLAAGLATRLRAALGGPRQSGAAGGRPAADRPHPAAAASRRRRPGRHQPAPPRRHHHAGGRRRRAARASRCATRGRPHVLGSGGGPARALPLLAADRFFIVNGDTLSDVYLRAPGRGARAVGSRATLAVAPADLAKYNALLADDIGRVRRHRAARHRARRAFRTRRRGWHFVGVQAVNAAAFAGVDPTRPARLLRDDLSAQLAAARAGRGPRVPTSGGVFYDIGTPEDYLRTAQAIRRRRSSGRSTWATGRVVAPSAHRVDTRALGPGHRGRSRPSCPTASSPTM